MDSVTDAKLNESKRPDERENILDRLQRLAVNDPDLTEYQLTTELEAQELLIAMAAMLKVMRKDVVGKKDKQLLNDYACQYRAAVIQGRALEYFRTLNAGDQLALFGLAITTPMIILQ